MIKEKVGIVILNWHCRDVIIKCLDSIYRAGLSGNVVVVDNGSDDGSVEKIRSQNAEIKIIENRENLGFAEGNNRGIEYCLEYGAKYIFILNPDTEINIDTIPNLLEVMEKDQKIGIGGPKILSSSPQGSHGLRNHSSLPPLGCNMGCNNEPVTPPSVSKPLIWSCGGVLDRKRYSGGLIGLGEADKGQYDKTKEVDFISGTAMMVRREVFEKCGLFYPDYFIYYEDVELNIKAQKAGFKLMLVPSSTIIHHESSTMGKNSPAQEYYMARNHMLFVERNAPIFIKIREFIRLPKTLYEHWRKGETWAIRGVGDYIRGRLGRRSFD